MEGEIIRKLTLEFANSRRRNPQYSLRAFARKLDVQASALSEIMNNKRKITMKMGKRILEGLCVNPAERENILKHKKSKHSDLSLEYFKIISDWYYFAILSLAEIPDFKCNPEWISKRLNISNRTAKLAIEKLIKLEMLELNNIKHYLIELDL